MDTALDHEQLRGLLNERALAHETLDPRRIQRDPGGHGASRRAAAPAPLHRLLLPRGVRAPRRHHPRARAPPLPGDAHPGAGPRTAIARSERGAAAARGSTSGSPSRRSEINVPGKPRAEFVCPGHPLLDATTDLILERYRHLLKRGPCLIDPADPGDGSARAVSTWSTRFTTDGSAATAAGASSRGRCSSWRSSATAESGRPGTRHTWITGRHRTQERGAVAGHDERTSGCARTSSRRPYPTPSRTSCPRHFEEVKRRKEELVEIARWRRCTIA